MKKSTHRVEVVKLNPFKHPNADSLSIQKVHDYQVVLRTEDWEGVTLGAYIVADSVVDVEKPEFAWLIGPHFRAAVEGSERYHRVTAMRLRGVVSYGLMVPAPDGSKEGDEISDLLEVTRYEHVLKTEGQVPPPAAYCKDYDLEAFEVYGRQLFEEGETVVVKEKLDGVNARFCFSDGVMNIGSRTIWLDPKVESVWSRILTRKPAITSVCQELNVVLYGEIVGFARKTKLRYGVPEGGLDFYLFDVLSGTEFLDDVGVTNLAKEYGLKVAPEVDRLPFDFEKVYALADGKTLVPGAKHKREGVVVRSLEERRGLEGRAVLKIVSAKALMA